LKTIRRFVVAVAFPHLWGDALAETTLIEVLFPGNWNECGTPVQAAKSLDHLSALG